VRERKIAQRESELGAYVAQVQGAFNTR
jgi:hypothetical protein